VADPDRLMPKPAPLPVASEAAVAGEEAHLAAAVAGLGRWPVLGRL